MSKIVEKIREAGRHLSGRNESKVRAAHAHLAEVMSDMDKPKKTKESAGASTPAMPDDAWQGEPYLETYGGLKISESLSFTDVMVILEYAIGEEYLGAYTYVRDVYADSVVFSVSYPNRDKRFLFQAPYSITEEGVVTLGDPVEVRSRTVYEPVDSSLAESETSTPPADDVVEIVGDCVPLREAAVAADGTIDLKIIAPGWNSSETFYYPKDVLARDIPTVFPIGTKMYLNHPTRAEEAARPEGEIEKVAATLKSTPVYMESGPDGPGMYAKAQVLKEHREFIDQLAPHIGPSIFCKGQVHIGEAEGKRGRITDQLLPSPPRTSVDFVTEPGAGGKIVQLFEAARQGASAVATSSQNPATQNSNTPVQEATVTEAEKKALQEENERLKEANGELQGQVQNLATVVGRLSEAHTVREAERVAAPIITATRLPLKTQERLLESVTAKPVLREDGTLDVEKFAESVKAAADTEITFAREAYGFGAGGVKNFGGSGVAPSQAPVRESAAASSAPSQDEADAAKRLQESFQARGMSESSARIASVGRA